MNSLSTIRYVDHTYSDFSRYIEEGGELIKHKKSGNNFPARLHKVLSGPNNEHAIAWMPHGRAWKIIDKERLIADVIPNYYVCKKYESFTRQLNGWGFKRLHQSGPDSGCYYHECFLRGLPKLTCLIRRLPPNMGKSTPFAEGEPNFYRITEACPLPPPPVSSKRVSSKKETPRTAPAPRAPSPDFSIASIDDVSLDNSPEILASVFSEDIRRSQNLSKQIPNQVGSAPAAATVTMAAVNEALAAMSNVNSNHQGGGHYRQVSDPSHSGAQSLFPVECNSYFAAQFFGGNNNGYADRYPTQGQPYNQGFQCLPINANLPQIHFPPNPHSAPIQAHMVSPQFSSYPQGYARNSNSGGYPAMASSLALPGSSSFSFSKQKTLGQNKNGIIDLDLEPLPLS